ncbi:MAG: heparinase II/III family protein, partial [Cyclobacteriaceae bacterium]
NFHAKEGNWLTMEMSGLAMVATAWPEFEESPRWISYAKNKMEEGLKEQVYPDGVQKELTSHYHQVALNNFHQFLEICDQAKEPLPEGYKTELEKMHAYIAYSVSPTGYGILNNDSDKRYNREIIAEAASAYNREDWLFIATNGKRGKRPVGAPSAVFPWAGQLIMRSGYQGDAHWAFFDVGPWGTGHQHNDKLHLSVSAYGRDLLVDGGRFAYRGEFANKFRKYAVGSASHNLILIDGNGQGAGPRVATEPLSDKHYRITDQFDYAWNAFNQFNDLEGQAKHTRAVFHVRGKFWVVVDNIETDRPRKIETLWHWHPDSKIKVEENGVVSTDHEKGNLKIIPVGFSGWNIKQIQGQEGPSPQGWYSERYNKAEPAPVNVYSTDIKTSTSFVWILYPSEGNPAPVETELISRESDQVTVRVKDQARNEWDLIIPFSNSEKASYSFRSGNEELIRTGMRTPQDAGEIGLLLSRINLNARGLEKVKQSIDDPAKAVSELLTYYRSRDFVKHPIDRKTKEAMLGKSAEENDLKVADDAMKHIFIGQSAYPPYYCGDDIDWGLRPVPDNEWVWQLNRMGFWDALGRAYWHTGDEKYAREWCLQLLDWTHKNPRDEEHAYAWRSIEAGIRGYRWMELFQRFVDSPSFTPEVLVAFLNSCYDHAAYLMTKYRKGSNWGLMEAEGMAFIAMTFPEFQDGIKWRDEAILRLNREIENQVYPDGHQRELAMGYHMSSIGWFKRTLDLASMNGLKDAFPKSYLEKIEKMCEVPFKLGYPDGTTTQFGDSWTGSPGHTWPRLKEWATIFDRDDFLYVATEGKAGQKPKATAFALETSGFYSMRSDWSKDAIVFVLKCGPDGGGHSQPDNGTFELYAGSRHLMPDAGSYIYSGDPENRAWFRQTKVHQTLTLNGENSASAPKQLLWRPGNDLDVLVVENTSYPNLTHRRAVFFVDKKYFVIVDEAMGKGKGDVDIHFQLAPGNAVFNSDKFSVQSDFKEGWNVFVQSMDQDGMQLQEEEGWVSFIYTKKERRPAFRYRIQKGSGEAVRFVTIVAPYSGSAPPKISAQIVGKPKPGASKLELKVTADGVSTKIGYEINGK